MNQPPCQKSLHPAHIEAKHEKSVNETLSTRDTLRKHSRSFQGNHNLEQVCSKILFQICFNSKQSEWIQESLESKSSLSLYFRKSQMFYLKHSPQKLKHMKPRPVQVLPKHEYILKNPSFLLR